MIFMGDTIMTWSALLVVVVGMIFYGVLGSIERTEVEKIFTEVEEHFRSLTTR